MKHMTDFLQKLKAEEHPATGYGYSAPSAPGHDIPASSYGHPTGGAYYHNSVYDGKKTNFAVFFFNFYVLITT